MLFNCFKYKNHCFEVFFQQNCKVDFGQFLVWHQCSLKAGAVSLVVFEPFYTMEALNNIVVLHLLHAAAIENAPPPPPCRYLPRIREDPFTLPDREFKRPFPLHEVAN